jgi:hypothetical protein
VEPQENADHRECMTRLGVASRALPAGIVVSQFERVVFSRSA